MKARETKLIGLSFKTPQKAEDTLYPQLFRMEKSLEELLIRNEFPILHTYSWSEEEKSIILMEFFETRLPSLQKRVGPPVWNEKNAGAFCEKYKNNPDTFSFSIENEDMSLTIHRKHKPRKLIRDMLFKEIAPKAISRIMKNVMKFFKKKNQEIKSESFWKFMNEYFQIKP